MMGKTDTQPGADVRQLRREATRAAIADAAMEMLLEGGIAAVTINQLAKRVGYTPGALYSYFSSRDALLAELQFRVFARFSVDVQELRAALDAAVAQDLPPVSVDLVFLLLVPDIVDLLASRYPQQYRFLSEMAGDPRELVNDQDALRAWPAIAPIVTLLLTAFEQAAQAGELHDGPAVNRLVVYLSALQGQMQARKVLRFFPDADDGLALLRHAAETLLLGWGAEASMLASGRSWLDRHPDLLMADSAASRSDSAG